MALTLLLDTLQRAQAVCDTKPVVDRAQTCNSGSRKNVLAAPTDKPGIVLLSRGIGISRTSLEPGRTARNRQS